MGKLWQRVLTDAGKSRVEEIDLGQVRITQPTIIYLSGFLTNNNRPDYVSGSIKCVQELLRNRPDPRRDGRKDRLPRQDCGGSETGAEGFGAPRNQ